MKKARTQALALPNISRTGFGKIVRRNERTIKTLAGAGLVAFGGISLFRLTSKTVRAGITLGGGNVFLCVIGNIAALLLGTILIATDKR